MKLIYFILIFFILAFCNTEDDKCSTDFDNLLQDKCLLVDSTCNYSKDYSPKCIKIDTNCEAGNESRDICLKTIPQNLHQYKCIWDNTDSSNPRCISTLKLCSDYNQAANGNIQITGDTCSSLSTGDVSGTSCYLKNGENCVARTNSCEGLLGSSCTENIPSTLGKKCIINDRGSCEEVDREFCEEFLIEMGKNGCLALKAHNSDAKCIYKNGECIEEKISCDKITDSTICNSAFPLNSNGNDYNYLYKCEFNSVRNKCEQVMRKCSDFQANYFPFDDKERCESLNTSDNKENKRCVFSGSNSCLEQYISCEKYNDYEIEKTRDLCESVVFRENENKKCVYINEKDQCVTKSIYDTCQAYEGRDKKICEAIISPITGTHCILDKDLTCKDREFQCLEAQNVFDCLVLAHPSEQNKKCVFNGNICYEEYKICEDFIEKDKDECENIYTNNGKRCVYREEKCKSKDKHCDNALTEEECEFIEKTGVLDPERKKCEWDGNYCKEIYKYCSDYRGNNPSDCQSIKPYDESGENLDLNYKCDILNANIGCEKVPLTCEEAGINAVLCRSVSSVIKDKEEKYCVFYRGFCKTSFKACNYYNKTDPFQNYICTGIIPEKYVTPYCEVKYDDNGNPKCVLKKECNLFRTFGTDDYIQLCQSIHPDCSYLSSICQNISKTCSYVKFYKDNEENEAICNSYNSTAELNKVCVLKKDKSGCEEVYNKTLYPLYQDQTENIGDNNDNYSARLNLKRMQFIIISLFSILLF